MYFLGLHPWKYIQHEGGTIPKTMRQLTCTDRPYKANRQISFGARMSITQYGSTVYIGMALVWPALQCT